MAATCATCGTGLSLRRRATGAKLCEDCEKRQAADRQQALEEYRVAIRSLATNEGATSQLPVLAPRTGLAESELIQERVRVAREWLEWVLEDEYLTEEEEASVDRFVDRLGLSKDDIAAMAMGLRSRFVIARANAGRLPEVGEPQIMVKPGEVVHIELPAKLMKEVVHRETRGAYSGFSIPITKGVRFKTGSYRGKSVVVGTSMEVADEGVFVITSRRAVFKGMRQTVESQLSKLVGLNTFTDGIQLHVSNRKTAPLIKVPDGLLVAAVINAAWQKL